MFDSDDELSEEAARVRADMVALFAAKTPVEPAKVTLVGGEADRLRKRYADEAARAHARDRLDAEGDERKRQIIEGDTYRDLKMLTAVDILPDGVFGSLETQLVSIGSCKTFDESKLTVSVVCPDCGYRPQRAQGNTARARVDETRARLAALRTEWEQALLSSLGTHEISEQVSLLGKAEKDAVTKLVTDGALPSPVTDALVKGVNQALNKFVVRRVSPSEVWKAVFPAAQPSTVGELRGRFEGFLAWVENGEDTDRVRVIPSEGPES